VIGSGRSKMGLAASGIPLTPRELAKSMLLLGTLRRAGWQRSSRERRSVDSLGEALPWLTYSAVAWLAGRVDRIHSVLEFGAGASTEWFAGRVRHVVSIEHDNGWADEVERRVPRERVEILRVAAAESGYIGGLVHTHDMTFDLVVVDGLHRTAAVRAARTHMTERSLLCLDDSQRIEYDGITRELHRDGFRSFALSGLAPIVADEKETRFFSRCLDWWMDGEA
jgi:hypothetical protein